ncbi:hypothetical protein FN846DRAFT_62434 [Sphaerosporella brunnea]|uniref:Uncharacterized protein n=1 Tax=Sphaerosporella brunnea TaxID=1250544 RepID=A0A5J5EU13_9PEZI|nr:hypothetical protein FN846DRAFT_62434 [Sphaerosporella brunnea]
MWHKSVEECERLGDISPYNYAHLYVAHKFDNTLELRRRGLLEAIENVDSLFSFNLSSSQEHTGCSSTHGQNTVPSRVPTHDYPNGNNTQSAAQHLTTAPTRKKRRRQGEEEEEDADDKRREDKDDRGPAPPKRPEMREVFKCFTPDERCEGLMFPDLDRLLHHMCQFHLSARCCPICEEKFHFNRERNKWTLHHGKSPKNQSGFKFFFRNDQDMKWHILRQHICPYRCPVCPDSKRFEGRQLRKHLKEQHPGATFDQQNIFKEASNLGIYELTQLTAKFLGVALTKAQMKRFLYWDGRKIYDFEDGHSSMNTGWHSRSLHVADLGLTLSLSPQRAVATSRACAFW